MIYQKTMLMQLLQREDHRFYDHGAIDIIGIGRAVFNNIKAKRASRRWKYNNSTSG